MRTRTVQVICAAASCLILSETIHAASPQKPRPRGTTGRRPAPARRAAAPKPATLPCGDYLGFQVLLDRKGFSPGQIDGRSGPNFSHAIAALQTANKLTPSGQPDCDTWKALGGDSTQSAITTYTVTTDDVNGPFEERIPRSLVEQAKLPSLGYQSATEEIAERFHVSPALLSKLNDGAPVAAGKEIRVPAVTPFNPDTKPTPDPSKGDITVYVVGDSSSLQVKNADGTIVFFAPVTTGSEHDPLPTGDYKVTGVSWHPPFHYNPDLFWDAKATDQKALINPGPNNPVGVVWISLSLEHYGLHGTPEPGNIGHTESHGCVRMTNWDAARVASLVKPGTPVLFR